MKENVSYLLQIYAKNPDNSPAKDERVTVTIDKLGIKRVVYTDSSGYANFSILNLNHSTPYFVINVRLWYWIYTLLWCIYDYNEIWMNINMNK